ncbi:hypothetical protein SDC9_187737 [bioreactor metagenome]|uniref:Uncharacterized protein n=1 Tax=bioreactor metagenome TaxID=1076179 RepID=A0A645HMB6_9ZZZZ
MDFIVLDAPVPQGFAVVGQRGIQGGVPEGEIIGGQVNGKIVALLYLSVKIFFLQGPGNAEKNGAA